MVETLPFEPHRFRTAAAHYLAGRPAYAPHLIARTAQLTGLTPQHRVLDLGCGPGQLARAFAPYAASVTGIDPEPEMLRLARENAPPNVNFLEGSSYSLPDSLAGTHLVTIGRAFHWMDRAATLKRLDELIAPQGAIALFQDDHPNVPENAWRKEFRAVLDRFVPPDQRPAWRGPDWIPHISLLLNSPFSGLEQIAVIERRENPVAVLADRALSMSSTSPEKLGPETNNLTQDLNNLAARLFPTGTFTEIIATQAVIAHRVV